MKICINHTENHNNTFSTLTLKLVKVNFVVNQKAKHIQTNHTQSSSSAHTHTHVSTLKCAEPPKNVIASLSAVSEASLTATLSVSQKQLGGL